jgi:hypothetical protein
VDKEVSNSNKTLKENLEKEFNFVKKNQNPDDDDSKSKEDDEVPAWGKSFFRLLICWFS